MSEVADNIQKIIDTGTMASKWLHGGPTDTIETAKGPLKTLAGINQSMTATVLAALGATSNTNATAGKGPKTFTIQAGKAFQKGQYVTIASGAIVMSGAIAAYAADTLVVDVDYVKGTGSAASWQVSLSGAPGAGGADTSVRPQLITKFDWET
jgi:hypothetical protein